MYGMSLPDATCKIRIMRGQTFFSCKSCFEAEERKAPGPPPEGEDYGGGRAGAAQAVGRGVRTEVCN